MGVVTGGGEYYYGDEITLTATVNEGYHFVKWSDGATNPIRTITVTDHLTLIAEFAVNVYTVTLTAENSTVTGSGVYNHGTEVTLTATPDKGYKFVQWSDGDTCTVRKIMVITEIELIAEFQPLSIGTKTEEPQAEKTLIYTQNQTLYLEGIADYYLFDMIGNLIYHGQSPAVPLPRGVYFVVSSQSTNKIIIR